MSLDCLNTFLQFETLVFSYKWLSNPAPTIMGMRVALGDNIEMSRSASLPRCLANIWMYVAVSAAERGIVQCSGFQSSKRWIRLLRYGWRGRCGGLGWTSYADHANSCFRR